MSMKQAMEITKLRRQMRAFEEQLADALRRIAKLEAEKPVKRGPGRPRKEETRQANA